MTTKKKTTKTTKKPEFSANKKLEKLLKSIKDNMLNSMGATKKEAIEQIRYYAKNFPRETDYNIVQYGNLLIYYGDVRDMYKKAGYGSTIDRMNDDKLWETYKRQAGYVARYLMNKYK